MYTSHTQVYSLHVNVLRYSKRPAERTHTCTKCLSLQKAKINSCHVPQKASVCSLLIICSMSVKKKCAQYGRVEGKSRVSSLCLNNFAAFRSLHLVLHKYYNLLRLEIEIMSSAIPEMPQLYSSFPLHVQFIAHVKHDSLQCYTK